MAQAKRVHGMGLARRACFYPDVAPPAANLIGAMITGAEPAGRHPRASDAGHPAAMALLVAFVVVLGTAYGILRYDPQAFTLRRADAFEHRNDATQALRGETNDRAELKPRER